MLNSSSLIVLLSLFFIFNTLSVPAYGVSKKCIDVLNFFGDRITPEVGHFAAGKLRRKSAKVFLSIPVHHLEVNGGTHEVLSIEFRYKEWFESVFDPSKVVDIYRGSDGEAALEIIVSKRALLNLLNKLQNDESMPNRALKSLGSELPPGRWTRYQFQSIEQALLKLRESKEYTDFPGYKGATAIKENGQVVLLIQVESRENILGRPTDPFEGHTVKYHSFW